MPQIAIERAMSSLAWLGLAHGLWLGLAAPSLAALALRARPGRPSPARHNLLVGAFLLATIGPFVIAAAHLEAARRSARRPVLPAPVSVAPATGIEGRPVHLREPRPSGPVRPTARARVARMARAARPWVLACWVAGLVGTAGLVVLAFGSSSRLLRRCRPAPEPVGREARRLGRGLGLRRCPPVLVHDTLDEPCLCGVIRPSVILPAGWLGEARPGLVAAVLAHELAHARRRDPLANLMNRLLEALVLFHPGARWLSRALRLQREHRADALAARLTGDARALAEALEGFARACLAPRRRGPLGAALGGESSTLLPRIQEILDMKSEPERAGLWPVVTLAAAGLLALAVATDGLAWEEPPARAAVAARPEAAASPVVRGLADDPQVTYEVELLEAADPLGLDFVAGDEGQQQVGLAFLSDVERTLLLRSASRSPSGRLVQAPKVTAFEASRAIIWLPLEEGRDLDEAAAGISVELSGESVDVSGGLDATHVRLSIRLAEENPGAARPDPEEAGARKVTCTLPSGGTVALSADDPADAAARGRERLILVTPRRVLTEEEQKRVGRPGPAAARSRLTPLKTPSGH